LAASVSLWNEADADSLFAEWMTRTVSFCGDTTSSLARSARVELSDKAFLLFVTISRPEFSIEPVPELPLASAANIWLTSWLSEVDRASDAAAELLPSAEMLSEAIIENKKIREAIIMVACLKIYIPPFVRYITIIY
jgi:hypothetical protein